MLRHLTGATSAVLLLVWLANVMVTRSMLIGVVFPIVGTILAFVWAFWTISERISERAQPQMLDLEDLERLKEAVRRKQGKAVAGEVVQELLGSAPVQAPERADRRD